MVDNGSDLAGRRSAIRAAQGALDGLGAGLHEASDADLAELMTEADAVCAQASAARAAVTAEAIRRGVVAESGMRPQAWVREHAPSLRQGGAAAVAKLATEVASAGRSAGSLAPDAGAEPDPASPLGIVWAAVCRGDVSPSLGLTALSEIDRLEARLTPEAVPTVTGLMLELGIAWGPTQLRRLRPRLLAEYGLQGEFDDLQDRLASAARLSTPRVESADLTEYQLLMTPEQAAVLEAAIGPLSAPTPNDETGERDLRPAGQRRVEALAEVCRRSASHDADDTGGADGPAGSSAAVHVTMRLSDLEACTGAGEVLGSTATGALISPETLRRIACDAALIPHVLGSAGEDLDLGRVVRLFNRAQRRRLWRRDQGCTYPGCTAPAAWTRAHHVLHWADGGPSDIDNAALLCQHHHTVVHRRRLWAEVRLAPDDRGRHVLWDLNPGSYDLELERRARERAEHDPPALSPSRLRALAAVLTSGGDDLDAALAEHDLALAAELLAS